MRLDGVPHLPAAAPAAAAASSALAATAYFASSAISLAGTALARASAAITSRLRSDHRPDQCAEHAQLMVLRDAGEPVRLQRVLHGE